MALYGASVEYGLHCLLHLVDVGDGVRPSSRDLAEFQGVSPTYVAKLFTQLEKAGLVKSIEGVGGGYGLGRPADEITVLDVVDALDGSCHRAYGSMPNMTWIFTRAGIPVYKSDWTDAESVENAIQYFLGGVERRREGHRLAPFHVQRLDFRLQDRAAFYKGLERNGPKAVEEFRKAFG